jgi:hypothetical protein
MHSHQGCRKNIIVLHRPLCTLILDSFYFKLWIYHDAPVPVCHLPEWWERRCPGCQEGQYPPLIKQPVVVSAFLSSYSKPSRQSNSQSVVVSTGFLLPDITTDNIYISIAAGASYWGHHGKWKHGTSSLRAGYHQLKVARRARLDKEHFDVSAEGMSTKYSIKLDNLSSFDSQFDNSLSIV